jgi:hypothetical protein
MHTAGHARTGIALLLIAGSFLAGCDRREAVSSELVTDSRDVQAFNAIDMRGNARLEVVVGPEPSLSIAGREAYVRRIRTEVRDGTLHISTRARDWLRTDGDPRLVVTVSVPELDSMLLRGGTDVRISGFDGGRTDINVEGAAHIKATGQLDELTVHLAGASHADLSKLIAKDAKVTVDGIGSVFVHSSESLDATMNGVGAIFYQGDPRKVNTAMNGLGKIARGNGNGDDREQPPERHRPQIDPDELQPELEKEPALEKVDSTPVI